MNQIAVVYRSKSGYTQQYAQWIARALDADLFDAREIPAAQMKQYETVIYGAGLYAVGVSHLRWARTQLFKYPHQRKIVFVTGLSPVREETLEAIWRENFSEKERRQWKLFYFRGGFDMDRLTLYDRFLMKLLKLKLERKDSLTADERGMLTAYQQPIDFTRRGSIDPLVRYVKEGAVEDRTTV